MQRILPYENIEIGRLLPFQYAESRYFPQLVVKAHGYRVEDSLGRTYVDWSSGWGSVLLGYDHPAMLREADVGGPMLPMMHPMEVEVAELLTQMLSCAEMVAFGKNGSDVTNAAVRLARAVTNRQVILHHGFHGFHDWYQVRFPGVHGIPAALADTIQHFPYNDLTTLEALLRDKYPGQVAAIIMEPVGDQ